MNNKTAIVIGAGPAGLTAAYELLTRSDIKPVILEQSNIVGGLAKTVSYKGYRMDMGGHRFFSKSDRVLDWWFSVLPLQKLPEGEIAITYQRQRRAVHTAQEGPDPEHEDRVMLLRKRTSRFYFDGKFFDYPPRLSWDTVRKLGLLRTARIAVSYCGSALFPFPKEETLEQFLINRFGRELSAIFFIPYGEKVWGMPASKMSAEWGAQRIKGLSIAKVLRDVIMKRLRRDDSVKHQRKSETSLIEHFLYPKYGAGHMWEEVAKLVRDRGGRILLNFRVERVLHNNDRVYGVQGVGGQNGITQQFSGDYFFSTMPVKELSSAFKPAAPEPVAEVARGLAHRDFIIVGLAVKRMSVDNEGKPLTDNWIYIQDPTVRVGRVEIFNNWSPYMVDDSRTVFLGAEYFCNKTDEIWSHSDKTLIATAVRELDKIGLIHTDDVLDGVVERVTNAYPAYWGTYDRFNVVREWFDRFENLFLIGRNGMHKYNNQDHSMLTAMVAVDNILSGRAGKENIWTVNTEQEYIEHKQPL